MRGLSYPLNGFIRNPYGGGGLLGLALKFFGSLGFFVSPLKITESGLTLCSAQHTAMPGHRFVGLGESRFRLAHTATQCINPRSRLLFLITCSGQP